MGLFDADENRFLILNNEDLKTIHRVCCLTRAVFTDTQRACLSLLPLELFHCCGVFLSWRYAA